MIVSVVYGGTIEERGASFKNAKDIAAVLLERGYDARLTEFGADIMARLKEEKTDMVFLCVQGKDYGDGTFQAMLDTEKIPYTGSGRRAASLINDKILCKLLFDRFGIRTPKWDILCKKTYDRGEYPFEEFGFPFVAKAPTQGGSYGIELIRSIEDIPKIEGVFAFDDPILLEKYVEGRFYTVGIYDHDGEIVVLPVVEGLDLSEVNNSAKELNKRLISFTGQYGIRESNLSYETDKDMQEMSRKIFDITKAMDVARIDFMVSEEDGKPYVLEINAVPGLKRESLLPKEAELYGVSYGDLIEDILKAAKRRG